MHGEGGFRLFYCRLSLLQDIRDSGVAKCFTDVQQTVSSPASSVVDAIARVGVGLGPLFGKVEVVSEIRRHSYRFSSCVG